MAFSSSDQYIESDLEAMTADVERFKADFREQVGYELSQVDEAAREFRLMQQNELKELASRIEQLVDHLQDMLAELRERARFVLSHGEAMQLASTVNTLHVEVDALLALLVRIEAALRQKDNSSQSFTGKAAAAARNAISALRNVFIPIVRRISQRLWRLLAGLITPKEWSIGGELGNTVWGLTKVKLEIKFGP